MSLLSVLARVSDLLPSHVNTSGAEVVTSDGTSLPLVGAKLRGDARGGIARLVLEQTFENRHDEPLHVTYRMPLPADGAVSAYAFEIAGRTITGRVDNKREAREQFESAVAEGKTAALLEQNRDDVFTQEIGNLPPNEKLIARITIDQKLVWLPEGEWELRFPTVIGPRYISPTDATERDARDTAIAVAADGVDARISIQIAIGDTLVAGRRASSPSHRIRKDADGAIELDTSAHLDRDIVIRWPVATREVGLALDVAHRGDRSFGLLTIVPPARDAEAPAMARDLIVLLDTSGSMGGPPLRTAKKAVALLIESLGERDRLELIEFSNQPRRYRPDPVAATRDEKQAAIRWLRKLEAGGGTEMGSAVREALTSLREGAQRQVVLVSDGCIGSERQIVELLHEELPRACRVHVLGVGSAVNRSLSAAVARAGRGAEVLAGIDERDDLERACKRLLDRTARPMLTDVEISGSALVRCAPEHVPDVFEGAPVVAGLELSPDGGELIVRGELASSTGGGHPFRDATEQWIHKIRVPRRGVTTLWNDSSIAALYARERVADLETRWTFGDTRAIDRQIEKVGVEFQIATRLTSWVAIDHDSRVDGTERHEVMPQMLPYGTSMDSFGLRAPVAAFGGCMPMGAPGAEMPASKSMMLGAPPMAASAPQPQMRKKGKPMPYVAQDLRASAPKSRRSPWLVLALIALVIALLVWWLVL